MVFFDTADQLGLGGGSANALRGLLRDGCADPGAHRPDHVMTKAFYLLRDFPAAIRRRALDRAGRGTGQ
jgi:hypothetical protein